MVWKHDGTDAFDFLLDGLIGRKCSELCSVQMEHSLKYSGKKCDDQNNFRLFVSETVSIKNKHNLFLRNRLCDVGIE